MDPGPCCCAFGDFYEREGIMPPIHDCPAPAPLEDFDFSDPPPMTDLERTLMESIDLTFGAKSGRIVKFPYPSRWE